MGKPKPQTATVAPKPQATVNVKVRFKATGAAVVGASLHSADLSGAFAVRELGKTGPTGELKKLKFDPGRYRLFVTLKNHRGEGMEAGDTVHTTKFFDGELSEGPRDFDVQMVQIRSQVTVTVVEDDPAATPIPGATVKIGAFTQQTDQRGVVVSDPLDIGVLHGIDVTREGYGPPAGTVEGAVSSSLDLRTATSVTDRKLPIQMKVIWGKVRSSRIEIEGQPFTTWYRQTFVPSFPTFHPTIRDLDGNKMLSFPIMSNNPGVPNFNQLFDDLPKWFGPELTVEEFVSIFLIVANETGGTFKPIAEKGSRAYMFYLNKRPNRLAGDQLKERGILTDEALITRWNQKGQKNYPGTDNPPPTDDEVKECDFWKYRGRGFVQLTLFTLYMDNLNQILIDAGLPGCEAMTADQLDDAVLNRSDVYYPMLKKFLAKQRGSWAKTNGQQWRQFGLAVAGQNNTPYGDLYQFRAEKLYDRFRTGARDGTLKLKA
jgi:hypothetical protein